MVAMIANLTVVVDKVVSGALLVLYIITAYVRWVVARHVTALRLSYLLSVPVALIFAGSYVWLLVAGESQYRLLGLRLLQLVVLCNVWIWPALVALQVRNNIDLPRTLANVPSPTPPLGSDDRVVQ